MIAGVSFLGALPSKLRQAVLLIEDKTAKGATADDAEVLADYMSRFPRGTVEWKDAVRDAMASGMSYGILRTFSPVIPILKTF